MILNYAICSVSVAPLRLTPSHAAEQVSQLLLGEKMEILEVEKSGWAKIRNKYDDYEGWCKLSQLTIIPKKIYNKEPKIIAAKPTDKLLVDGREIWLPIGAELSKTTFELGELKAIFKSKKLKNITALSLSEQLKENAYLFLHSPYQWGGRSLAGIDCSGFTQLLYKLVHIKLPRDASQQANCGSTIDFLQNAHCGDLAFFDNEAGTITHVGMLLDNSTIIHATDSSGKVVVDKIDNGGIISTSLKVRTHNLRLVKRYF